MTGDRNTVYISGPITLGDEAHNFDQADRAHLELVKAGFAPFNPMYSMASKLKAEMTWDDWLNVDLAWIRKADCLLRLPGISKGADLEHSFALKSNVVCFQDIPTLVKFWRQFWAKNPTDRTPYYFDAMRACRQNGFIYGVNV